MAILFIHAVTIPAMSFTTIALSISPTTSVKSPDSGMIILIHDNIVLAYFMYNFKTVYMLISCIISICMYSYITVGREILDSLIFHILNLCLDLIFI